MPDLQNNKVDLPWSALVVDDDAGIRQSLRLCLEAAGARVLGVGTRGAALNALERSAYDVVLLDLWLGLESGLETLPLVLQRQPDAGVIVITAFASFESAVEAMKRGAADYLPKPFTPDQVRLAAQRVLAARRLRDRVVELEARVEDSHARPWFETRNPTFSTFLDSVRRAAASDAVVLLRGESGTGKSMLAEWVKNQSARRQRPFVTLHCPMLSSDLISSALFGHRKGAFVGATEDAAGKLQEAEGGTLFLDEIGDLPLDAQARLLRLLGDQSYERVGESKERRANVRVVAATNRPLEELVRSGRLREDLLFRLNVLTLALPPLRERREDVMPLAEHYLRFFAVRRSNAPSRFSPDAVAAMSEYAWPGNLRELRNAIERAVILGTGSEFEAHELGIVATSGDPREMKLGALVRLEDLEREHIARVIARAPTLDSAARTLGIDITTLHRKRKRYGLA